jgi:hypothetical protein
MAKSAVYETAQLALLLNATPIPNIADNTVTGPLTSTYVALHTANPGASGNQTTNEIAYTGYARVPVVRSNSAPAWVITGNSPASASPTSPITFPLMTGGTGGAAAYASIGALATGAGVIYYFGQLSPAITVQTGVTPQLTTSTQVQET